jgi:hypothetical protein
MERWAILLKRPRITGKYLMRIGGAIFVVTVLTSSFALCAQGPSTAAQSQTPRTAEVTQKSAPPAVVPAVATPSSLLQPSLDSVQHTLAAVKVERWKRGSVRDEAGSDMNSIQVDLQQRMPALLKDADAAPGILSKTLPVTRHVDALYDVLLRVVEASRIAAPDDQANQLRQALSDLEKARLALDDSMEQAASSQEKQLVDLRVTVAKQAEFKCPAPPPPPVCPKPEKKPVRRRPKPAATTAPATTPQPAPQKLGTPAGGASQQKPAAAKPATTKPQ